MQIRQYQPEKDRGAVIALSSRLADFELPERTKREAFAAQQRKWMEEDLEKLPENSQILVLTDQAKTVQGFLELQEELDWLTNQKRAYLSRICLSKDMEGQGYGKKFMQLAEDWAIKQGYQGISLMVIASNQRAAAMYEAFGYELETMRMYKSLT